MTAIDELKRPDCGNTTEKTDKNAEVEKSEYVDEDTNNLDKLRLFKIKPRSCLNMMKPGKQLPMVESTLMKTPLLTFLSFG